MTFKQSESGRSMVEMLGTLAIIGVLSVGGIMGYSYGMNRYRANETINDVNLRAMDLIGQLMQGTTPTWGVWGEIGTAGYPISLNSDEAPINYYIKVEKVPFDVCNMIADMMPETVRILVDNETEQCAKGLNEMNFSYVEFEKSEGLECKIDTDCSTEEFCLNGMCHILNGVHNFDTGLSLDTTKTCSSDDECEGICNVCVVLGEGISFCSKTVADGTGCTVDGKEGLCVDNECVIKECDESMGCKGRNEYCASPNNNCSEPFGDDEQGVCVAADFQKYSISGIDYYVSYRSLSKWDAEAACLAINQELISGHDLLKNWEENNMSGLEITELGKKLNDILGDRLIWTKEHLPDDPCGTYGVTLANGKVMTYFPERNRGFAVCK